MSKNETNQEQPENKELSNEPGNTSKRVRSCNWFFTYNNPKIDNVYLSMIFELTDPKGFIFQKEMGANGTEHYQGVIVYKLQKDFNFMKQIDPKIHWEKAKSLRHAINYCQKSETKIDGPWSKNIEINTIEPKSIEIKFEWWGKILEIINEKPDHRTIHWVYDELGNMGKTYLCKTLCESRKDCVYLSGKSSDMKYAISKMKTKPRVILMDFPRCTENYISYAGIEEIKNGIFFSGKYESTQTIYDSPHVICFANHKPIMENMSSDRWNIITLQEK